MIQTRRFDLDYRPLNVSVHFDIVGSVPAVQNYDADAAVPFTPDYRITPLIIQPQVRLIGEGIEDTLVNHLLTNMRWTTSANPSTPLVNGPSVTIGNSTTATRGRLQYSNNCWADNAPLTFIFEANVADPRGNGQVYQVRGQVPVRIVCVTAAPPQIELSVPPSYVYNPLHPTLSTLSVRAQLICNGGPVATEVAETGMERGICQFVWDKLIPPQGAQSAQWMPLTDYIAQPEGYDISIHDHTERIEVELPLLETEVTIRCRARYARDGELTAAHLPDDATQAAFTIKRQAGQYWADYSGVPDHIPPTQQTLHPICQVKTIHGMLSHPEQHFAISWHTASNQSRPSAQGVVWTQVAQGAAPSIPTTALHQSPEHGIILGMDLQEIGPTAAWATPEGELLTDEQGNILLLG